ncbi:MAG: radical SAM protein [Deltaproteobacteria bacterium]|nr:radical SAM protein [Deltaproteobacteria bacterium]
MLAPRSLGNPLRIGIFTRADLFPANHGAAVKIVRTAEALVRAGDHVVLVSDDRDAYLRWQDGWKRVSYEPRFRAIQEAPFLRDQARFERWLARIGYPVDEHFLYRPVVDPAWWARALYVGLRERLDVYQAEFPGYAVPAQIASRLLGGRSVLVQHNVEHDRLRQMAGLSPGALRRIRLVEEAIVRAVDEVIAVSEDDRQRMGAREHIRHVPHGVDLAAFTGRKINLRRRYELPPGPVIFFHGTLHYAPNTEAVRWLASELAPSLKEGSILCAGLSPPVELARDRLRFCGPVEDLAAHIESADLCACPLFAGGGTRLKLVEYFAAGKAVVSTPLGAEGLEVRHEEHLLLADRDALVPTIHRALGDSKLRKRLGANARRWASGRDWSAVASAYRAIHRGDGRDFVARPTVEAHLPPRLPSKPLTMLLLVNRGCNLRCSFCDLWDRPEEMPTERALRLLDEAAAIGTKTLVITGGEPLLHGGIFDIVRAARARGLSVNITTNGTLVERHYDALVESGVSSLSFSIDGTPATHDRIRGQKGAHGRTWKALLRTIHDGRIDTAVYFVVTRENVGELVTVYEQARAAGARFDFWPVNDAKDQYLTTPEAREAWLAAIDTLSRRDAEVAAKAHYYAEALGYHGGETGAVRCLGLVDQYGVTYKGDLLPCCVWGGDGLVVGNVFERPLRELWASREVQDHREKLWGEGCTVGCYNHSLYELVASTGESHRVG